MPDDDDDDDDAWEEALSAQAKVTLQLTIILSE